MLRRLAINNNPEVSRSRRCTRSRKRSSGAQITKPLDDAETQPAATVDGDAGRFVQSHQVRILIHDGALQRLQYAWIGSAFGTLGRGAQRRDAHGVSRAEPIVLPNAGAIYAYFATTQYSIDVGRGYALQCAAKEIVDALSRAVGLDADLVRRVRGLVLKVHDGPGNDSTRVTRPAV